MSEKVKVKREIAEYIEGYPLEYPKCRDWKNRLLMEHSYQFFSGSYADVSLKNVSPLGLSKILLYGYEVEETPEEKLAKWYMELEKDIKRSYSTYDRGNRDGILRTLNTLGIEIEGIGKHDN